MASKTPLPSLPLDYHPDLGDEVLGPLERSGRAAGLPLAQLELLGQDAETALGFVAAVEHGDITGFMAAVDWDSLEARLTHQLVAAVAL